MNQKTNENTTNVIVNNISNNIDYQSEGVVSKQILKKFKGNITLFAFDKEQSLTEHTSPFEAVVHVIEGIMEIKIGGNPYTVSEGEVIIMPPNIPHGLVAKEKTKMILIMIKN
jgi:quercetin dioxygenase-like cupin family protein